MPTKAKPVGMQVLSIQIGKQEPITARGQTRMTGSFKRKVEGPQYLGALGFVGDHHEHKEVHGGEARALYAVAKKAYDFWRPLVPKGFEIEAGLFGENLLMDELVEHDIHVGDIFNLGDTVIQATMPRFPCILFEARVQVPGAVDFMYESERTGVLFRVKKEGYVRAGDRMELMEKSKIPMTIPELLHRSRVGTLTRKDWEYIRDLQFYPQMFLTRLEKNITV